MKKLLTVEELGAMCVALLHLLAFVRCRFHIADRGGKNGGPGLHQHLAEVDTVAGRSAMQRSPDRRNISSFNDPDMFPSDWLMSLIYV